MCTNPCLPPPITAASAASADASSSAPSHPANSAAASAASWTLKWHKPAGKAPATELVEDPSGGRSVLTARVPEKWLNMHITTQGGGVSVTRVVEADLVVRTHGGAVTLGTVRANAARIDSRLDGGKDGVIVGGEVSGSDVLLQSGTGGLKLRRFVAQRGQATASGTGCINIGALYGEGVALSTGLGSIDVGMMDCGSNVMASPGADSSSGSSEAAPAPGTQTSHSSSATQHGQPPSGDGVCAVLSSKGGVISVRGLDGNARVSSGGGAILLHLYANVREVSVASEGGPVSLALAGDVSVRIDVSNAQNVECLDGIELQYDSATQSYTGTLQPTHTYQPHHRVLPGSVMGHVKVDAGATGVVTLKRVSWMEALQARVTATAAEKAAAASQ
ncbi:MAG: hypothetical protein WDW36_008139 [Sanguina aurantia]